MSKINCVPFIQKEEKQLGAISVTWYKGRHIEPIVDLLLRFKVCKHKEKTVLYFFFRQKIL